MPRLEAHPVILPCKLVFASSLQHLGVAEDDLATCLFKTCLLNSGNGFLEQLVGRPSIVPYFLNLRRNVQGICIRAQCSASGLHIMGRYLSAASLAKLDGLSTIVGGLVKLALCPTQACEALIYPAQG